MSRISLEVVADSKQLLASLNDAQKQVEKFMAAAKDAGAELGGGVNRALDVFQGLAKGGAASAGVLGGALLAVAVAGTALGVSAAHNAEELVQLSSKLGLGTDKLQEYEVLLHRVGLSGDDLVLVFRKLALKLEEARLGTGTAADRFRQLGIDIKSITGTDDLFRKIAEASSGLAAGLEKDAVMGDLMGRSALRLIPAWDGGTAAMDAAARKSEELGAILGGAQVASLVETNHALSDMSIAWKRFSDQMGNVVAPSIRMVTEVLTQMLAFGANAFKAMDTAMETLAIRFSHFAVVVQEVARVLFSKEAFSGEAWKQVGANIQFIDQQAASLIAKTRELATLANPTDNRAKPPALDTKISSASMLSADAQIKAMEAASKAEQSLMTSMFDVFKAQLASWKAINASTDVDIAKAHEAGQTAMGAATKSVQVNELNSYIELSNKKMALFSADAKGAAERAKFQIDANAKIDSLLNQIAVTENKNAAASIAAASATAVAIRAHTIQALDDEILMLKAIDAQQHILYKQESLSIGAADAVRKTRIALIDAEGARERVVIAQTIADEERKASRLASLDTQQDARRKAVAIEFPGVFQRQMQDIVNSATFSTAHIVNTWSSGIATMILKGGNLKATMEATEMALLQGFLNLGAKMVAEQLALAASTTAIWAGATQAIGAMFLAVGTAVQAFFVETLWPMMVAVGTAIVSVLSAIADAIASTGFGIPIAIGLVVAIGVLVAVLSGGLKLAHGGIATGPTNALIGEGGSPEAVIPLNASGASFMRSALGVGGGAPIHTHVYLNGREIAMAVSDQIPGSLRTMGVL